MKLSARKGKALFSAMLACALVLLGAPAAPLYADEADQAALAESSAVAPSDGAAQSEEPAAPEPTPSSQDQGADSSGSDQDSSAGGDGAPSDASDLADPTTGDTSQGKDSESESDAPNKDKDKDAESKDADDENADDEEKKKEKEEKDKEALAKKAEAAYEEAKAEAASAEAKLYELPGLQAELAPCPGQLADAWARLQEVDAQRKPFEQERQSYLDEQAKLREERDEVIQARESASERKAKAVYGLALVDEQIAKTGGVDLLSVILGTVNATEAEGYGYLLGKVAGCIADKVAVAKEDSKAGSSRVDEVNGRIAAVADKILEVDQRLAESEEQRKALLSEVVEVVERGNAVAFAMERICSEARQGTQDAATKVLALSGVDTTPNTTSAKAAKAAAEAAAAAAGESSEKKEADPIPDNVAGFVKDSKDWDVKDNPLRVSAQDDAGAWYDAVDALAGADGYISYGMGLDFALSEEAFVEKWAAVVTDFYAGRGNPPLGGWGEDIARQAYAYHIDPRLCAAVSINESGGGAVCIRPHNAWGWGAADTDPYNLASEWASWPIAIESWHRGMATNTMGLATSPSVSKLSDIYCGTPIWAQRAVDSMEQMYEIAKGRAASEDHLALAVEEALKKAQNTESEEGSAKA